MKKIFNIILTIILICIILIVYFNIDEISSFLARFFTTEREIVLKEENEYKRDYEYIKFYDDDKFYPMNKDEILNVYFNILNKGYDEFTFYCPYEYESCIDDIKIIANDNVLLSKINNYVSPYNSFEEIETSVSDDGTIYVKIIKKYTENEIKELEKRISDIIYELNISDKDEAEAIKSIHNYIIKNVNYDNEMAEKGKSSYVSNLAYGALVQEYAICNGYSDAMGLFLDKMNIPNIKVSSEEHVWNLVYINNEWLHLDLTWDDTENTRYQNLYFLINTEELFKLDANEHNYDKSFYLEAK